MNYDMMRGLFLGFSLGMAFVSAVALAILWSIGPCK